jgi:hypothetical protein
MKSLRSLHEIPDLTDRFREMADTFSAMAAQEGIRARPYNDPSLPHFSNLKPDEKDAALRYISLALQVFEETRAEGSSLRSSPRTFWRALQYLGYVPQSDIFDKMHDSSVVLCFSLDQLLVFYSLNFFDYISFTLEDIYSRTWNRLSRRDPSIEQLIARELIDIVSGKRAETYDPGIREHEFHEIETEELLRTSVKIDYFSPIRSKGRPAGGIIIQHARVLESLQSKNQT